MTQDSTETQDTLVLVGEITAPFGVRGQCKMKPFLDNPSVLAQLPAVHLTLPNGRTENVRILNARLQSPGVAQITLAGVETREAAEALRGTQVRVPPTELPPLPEGQYYEWQLRGMQVETESGRDLGVIEEIYWNPANEVYETEFAMIPAIDDVISHVDIAARKMIVRDIPGLRKDE